LLAREFVHFNQELLDIIRARGWSHIVVFYDEANRLPRDLSVDLLVSNEEALSSAGVMSVYVASPSMAEAFAPLRDTFGYELRLGPFRSIQDMRRLLARYYFGDAARTDDLPATPEAMDRLWSVSRGEPYLIQLIAGRGFQCARDQGAREVQADHIA